MIRIWKDVRLHYQVLPRNNKSNIAESESIGARIIMHGT